MTVPPSGPAEPGARPRTHSSTAETVLARHLIDFGAEVRSDADGLTVTVPGAAPVRCDVDWSGGGHSRLDEVTAQAVYGLMAVHGRAQGTPTRLGVDYVSAATGVVAAQGVLAAALSGLRGQPISAVSTSAASTALLTVSQYLAAATANDVEHVERPDATGTPPPFTSADGVRFELETLDPEPWRRFWTDFGVAPQLVARGWRGFVLRYAVACAPLPAELHTAIAKLSFGQVCAVAHRVNVQVQPLRTQAERLSDLDQSGRSGLPWALEPTGRAGTGAALPTAGLPLAGLVVVEAGRRVQGPLAGQVLRLLGADVIRVEPAGGDPLRGMPPMVGDCSARFLALNRGKRIVEVDLRSVDGRSTVRELVSTADVFVHNWAPGKAAEFGLDSADFVVVNPGLVYAYASGWGAARGDDPPPGTDFMVQAYAGLGEQLRPEGEPPAGSLMTLVDVLGGLIAAEGILAGLVARHRDGRGQRVDSSLLSAAGVLQPAGRPARPVWGPLDVPLPAADGHLMLPTGTPEGAVTAALGVTDLDTALRSISGLAAVDALALLHAAGAPAVRVRADPKEIPTDPESRVLLEFDGCAFVRSPWRLTR